MSSIPMKSPVVMKQHDPDDDPFANLGAEMDAKALTLPTDFGSGAVGATKAAPTSPKKTDETSPAKDELESNTQE
jgi:hypothetical protein